MSLNRRFGSGWKAEMSGPSFAFTDLTDFQRFVGALRVASAWFALVRQEAQALGREEE